VNEETRCPSGADARLPGVLYCQESSYSFSGNQVEKSPRTQTRGSCTHRRNWWGLESAGSPQEERSSRHACLAPAHHPNMTHHQMRDNHMCVCAHHERVCFRRFEFINETAHCFRTSNIFRKLVATRQYLILQLIQSLVRCSYKQARGQEEQMWKSSIWGAYVRTGSCSLS